jgi:histidyl-tRNA synthetase
MSEPSDVAPATAAATSGTPSKKEKGEKEVQKGKLEIKTVKGMADWKPEQMALREHIFSTVARCFRRHGAVTIQTPIAELKATLTGKYGDDAKLIYDLADQGGEISALRYDLTVPFARYVATHGVQAIKRYQFGLVYRRDQPGKGRYREFYQCDFDIAGEYDAMLPDAECVVLLMEALDALALPLFRVKLNHRRLLDAMFQACGVAADKFAAVCSSIDKLDKLSPAAVADELVTVKHQSAAVVKKLMDLLQCAAAATSGGDPRATVAWMRDSADFAFVRDSPQSKDACAAALADLALLIKYVDAYGRLECGRLRLDLSLARGLDYYTGIIVEAVYTGDEDAVGSVAGGGRYDDLVGMFSSKKVPSVGFSLGVERVFTILDSRAKKEKRELRADHTEVFVIGPGEAASATTGRMAVLSQLWQADIAASMYIGSNPKLPMQMKKAGDVPLILIAGEDEVAKGVVVLKNNRTAKEPSLTVPRAEMLTAVRAALAAIAAGKPIVPAAAAAPTAAASSNDS